MRARAHSIITPGFWLVSLGGLSSRKGMQKSEWASGRGDGFAWGAWKWQMPGGHLGGDSESLCFP